MALAQWAIHWNESRSCNNAPSNLVFASLRIDAERPLLVEPKPTRRLGRSSLMNTECHANSQRWYVVHTNAKQEDRAANNLRAWQVETFSPRMKERRYNQFTNEPILMTRPLFPRYIFARFEADQLLHKVSNTRGVHS